MLAAFAPLFTEPSWLRAQALLCGVLLAPANHTLTAALRVLGLAHQPGFQYYHRLLNRARWSARDVRSARVVVRRRELDPLAVWAEFGAIVKANMYSHCWLVLRCKYLNSYPTDKPASQRIAIRSRAKRWSTTRLVPSHCQGSDEMFSSKNNRAASVIGVNAHVLPQFLAITSGRGMGGRACKSCG